MQFPAHQSFPPVPKLYLSQQLSPDTSPVPVSPRSSGTAKTNLRILTKCTADLAPSPSTRVLAHQATSPSTPVPRQTRHINLGTQPRLLVSTKLSCYVPVYLAISQSTLGHKSRHNRKIQNTHSYLPREEWQKNTRADVFTLLSVANLRDERTEGGRVRLNVVIARWEDPANNPALDFIL